MWVDMDVMKLQIEHDFIDDDTADAIKGCRVHLYRYRNGVLKRAPKTEFYRHDALVYSWGQHRSNDAFAQKFPEWMEQLAQKLPEPVNHAIIIRYHDGVKTHAPWHSDKCEELGRKTGCMKRGTGFYVISVGTPRVFQLGDEGNVVWEATLPEMSLLFISAETNALYKHCVPPDPNWSGCRWSLIFRTIV